MGNAHHAAHSSDSGSSGDGDQRFAQGMVPSFLRINLLLTVGAGPFLPSLEWHHPSGEPIILCITNVLNSSPQDPCFANALVNHFSGPSFTKPTSLRAPLRHRKRLAYAWMDFNVSVFLPPSVDHATFRLPYKESLLGRGPHPYDTAQGELDYDPFALDVGTLGVAFCYGFQVRLPSIENREAN
jgi:hypothetical protein